jgi:hypothetical protein
MIRLKAQTTESVLSDTLMPEQLQGDPLNLDSYKGVTLTQRSRGRQFGVNTGATGPSATVGDQEYSQTPVERRTVVPQFWEYAELFDPRDERALMRAVRPDGQYAQNVVAAFNRKKDDVILAALIADVTINGDSFASTNTTLLRSHLHGFRQDTERAYGSALSVSDTAADIETTSAIATASASQAGSNISGTLGALVEEFAAGPGENGCQQIVSAWATKLGQTVSVANASAGLHLAKLLTALEVLHTNGMAAGTKVHCVLHPEQVSQLMSEAQYTSVDYNALRPLQSGTPVDFMGMSFRVCNQIVSETVLTDIENQGRKIADGDATAVTDNILDTATGRYVYCYTEDCGVFGMTDDVTVRFDEIPERGYSLQCYHNFGLGSARMDPKKMVIIPCIS